MSDLGPTGEHVAQTVGKFREARNLGYAALSRRLAALGRKIPPLALRRIEAGERRVDVDDLVALAVALDVTPLALLLPAADRRRGPVGARPRPDALATQLAVGNWAAGGIG